MLAHSLIHNPYMWFKTNNCRIKIEADESLLDGIMQYSSGFDTDTEFCDYWLELTWIGEKLQVTSSWAEDKVYHVDCKAMKVSVTWMIISAWLGSRPNTLSFHANAVYNPRHKLAIVMMGNSGMGKTTLTNEFLKQNPDWIALTEDHTSFNSVNQIIWRYKRNASIRTGSTCFVDSPYEFLDADSAEFDRVAFVELRQLSSLNNGNTSSIPGIVRISALTESLHDELIENSFSFSKTRKDQLINLEIKAKLTTERWILFRQILDDNGVLFLGDRKLVDLEANTINRPSNPQFKKAETTNILSSLLQYWISTPHAMLHLNIDEMIERFQEILCVGDVYQLEPGGSPEETAEMLTAGIEWY